MTNFGAIITAMITPFSEDDLVDFQEANRLATYLVESGTQTLLLSGTTGESPTLTHEEEFKLYESVKAHMGSKALIMAGTGSNSTRTAVKSTERATEIGVDAILQVVPYYNKPSQEGLYQHFKAIAESTHLPIMLYNIPGRTACNMLPETTARLAEIPNIVGIKEAAGSIDQVKEIRRLTSDEFQIYCGDDGLTLDFLEVGAQGVVSVASHVAGLQIKTMIETYLSGDTQKARELEKSLKSLFDVLFISTNPTPVKAACRMMGFKAGRPRLPLVDVSSAEEAQIKEVLNKLNIL